MLSARETLPPGGILEMCGIAFVVPVAGVRHCDYVQGWVHAIEGTTSGHKELPHIPAGAPQSLWTLEWMKNSCRHSIFPLNTRLFFTV